MELPTFQEHCDNVDHIIALKKRADEYRTIQKSNNGQLTKEQEEEYAKVVIEMIIYTKMIDDYHKAFRVEFSVSKTKQSGQYLCSYKYTCKNKGVHGVSIRHRDSPDPGYKLGVMCDECLEALRKIAVERKPQEEEAEEGILA